MESWFSVAAVTTHSNLIISLTTSCITHPQCKHKENAESDLQEAN
jgi:hypothetical protein